ncbi:MAG: serine protein kinase RIO [Rhodocyclaceae bacterium]|jgi:RIO kinase 1|nr:serine protein kinase RIO [Rhodocyclaceae bacterium]MBK6908309.1 serine protein kinase RIO [Rhodocyclaceae bacterium]
MKTPKRIEPLVAEGLVDEVVCQLMSGKEANVYMVRCGDEIRCAKVYKDVQHRSFRNNTSYQEGRKTKNSRQLRAMEKGSRYGRQMQEEAWQSAEVNALYRLADAGVRVPQPYLCYEGVLLMDLVTDAEGHPAPRLNDVELTRDQALSFHADLLEQVVRMLCAGIIHGDLSEYNILVGAEGPVIIDLPQAVDAAGNNNASTMLERDVANLASYFGRFVPELIDSDYGKEIWRLYQSGDLIPGTKLMGEIVIDERIADVSAVLEEVKMALQEEERRRLYQGS